MFSRFIPWAALGVFVLTSAAAHAGNFLLGVNLNGDALLRRRRR